MTLRIGFALLFLSFCLLALSAHSKPLLATEEGEMPAAPGAEWLEPRGLNVVDLVGRVPESQLVDAILAYSGVGGIVQYVSGQRTGDEVTIHTRISPGYLPNNTIFGMVQTGRKSSLQMTR